MRLRRLLSAVSLGGVVAPPGGETLVDGLEAGLDAGGLLDERADGGTVGEGWGDVEVGAGATPFSRAAGETSAVPVAVPAGALGTNSLAGSRPMASSSGRWASISIAGTPPCRWARTPWGSGGGAFSR